MKKRVSWRVVRIIAAAVFLAVAVASFTGLAGMGAMLLHVQFGPALLKLIAAFSAGTLATVLGIVLVTYLFGRFYCAVFCPLGILQDVIGFLSRRKAVETRNFAWLRYAVAECWRLDGRQAFFCWILIPVSDGSSPRFLSVPLSRLR